MSQIKIGMDMMGGDYAPTESVKGLASYLSDEEIKSSVYCIGNETELKPLLQSAGIASDSRLQIVHAPETIAFDEHPTKALRAKPHSSIAVGFYLLAKGDIDVFVSAGNTGAMLVGAMLSVKTIKGVLRPSIPTFVPKLDGSTGLLLDVGLNADCKPEHLNQFAVLGSEYAKIFNAPHPSVGLLNVGEEPGKGNLLYQAAFPLLKENKQINFIGNVEGRDLYNDKADVIVCDGFTGNIVLKLAESMYEIAVRRNMGHDAFFRRFHYENYGGTPVLGIAKPVIIGHGISNDKAFRNILIQAERMYNADFCGKLETVFA